jgi:glycosyltransferase involved in cell wall biosynthesis
MLQLMRGTFRFANTIIANSEGVAADISQLLRMSRDNIEVVFNPIDMASIESLSREEVDLPWNDSGRAPTILGVGRLDVLKDFQTLIRAFSIVRSTRDCRLVILGEGPDRAKLEALVRESGLPQDVYMPGFVRNPFAWMRHASVLVSSSLTEGCPNAVMQALACGTCVVSTDSVGGSSEILEGGKWGRLVAVGDAEAMADAIAGTLDASSHPEVRQRAKDFAQERIAGQYLQVLLPNHQRLAADH